MVEGLMCIVQRAKHKVGIRPMHTQNLQETLRKLVEGLPQTLPDLLSMARSLEHQGDVNSSIRILRQALARHPSSKIHVELGTIYMKNKRFKDALMHLVDVLRENPQHHPTILLVCECLIECEEYDRASGMLQRARDAGAPKPRLQNLQRMMQEKQLSVSQQVPWQSPAHSQLRMSPLDPSTSSSVMTSVLPEDTVQEMSILDPTAAINPADMIKAIQQAGPADQTAALPASFYDNSQEEDPTTVTPFDREAFAEILKQHPQAPPLPTHTPSDVSTTGEFDFHNETRALPTDVPTSAIPPDSVPFPKPPPGVTPHYEDDDPTTAFESPYRRAGLEAISQPAQDPAPPKGISNHLSEPFSQPQWEPQPSWAPEEGLDEQSRDEVRAKYFGLQEDSLSDPIPNRIIPKQQNAFVPPPIDETPLELADVSEPLTDAPRRSKQAPPTTIMDTGADTPRKKTGKTKKAKSKKGGNIGLMLIVLPLLLALAAFGLALYADQSIAKQIQNNIELAKKSQQLDSFEGHQKALELFKHASQTNSFLGAKVDAFIQTKLPALPGFKAQNGKQLAMGHAAMVASLLEYRFEHPGKYKASDLTKQAQASLGERHPRVLHSRIYQSLLTNPALSVTLADGASQQYPRAIYIREAHIDAMLQTGQITRAFKLAEEHFKAGNPSSYQRLLLAQSALATHQHKLAGTTYQSILDSGREKHLEARFGLALIKGQSPGRALEAAKQAQATLKTQEKTLSVAQRVKAYSELSLLYLLADETKQALKHAKTAHTLSHVRPDLFVALITRYLDMGKLDQAKPLIEMGLKQKYNTPAFTILQARMLRLQGQNDKALALLEKAPNAYPQGLFEIGMIHFDLGALNKAKVAFEQGQGLDPLNGAFGAMIALSKQLKTPQKSKLYAGEIDKLAKAKEDYHVLIASAQSALLYAKSTQAKNERQDNMAKAKKRLIQAKRQRPYASEILHINCQLHLHTQSVKLAARDCKAAYNSNPKNPRYRVDMIRNHLLAGKVNEALAMAKPARESFANSTRVSEVYARSLLVAGQFTEAQKELDRWADKPFSKTAQYATLQGIANFHAKAYTAAQNYLEQAIIRDESAVEPKIFNAYTQLRFGKLKKAEKPLTKHLKDATWGAYAWLALGELRRRQKRFKDAETNLKKAIKLLEKQQAPAWVIAEGYMQRALAWQDKHGWKHERVKQYLDEAQKQIKEPITELSYLQGLYVLNQDKPDFEKALKHFQNVLNIQPNHCLTLKSMVYTNKKLNKEKANKAINKTIKKHCSS